MLFLFGTKTQYEHIAPLEMTCPLCGRKTCGLYWSAQKATAYFIPVATLKRTYVTGCSRCEKYWEVDQSLAKRLHRQLKPETAAVAEAPSGKAPTAAAGPTKAEAEAALIKAAGKGDADLVKDLIKRGLDVNARDMWGQTALLAAVEEGHLKAARVLLSRGADVNARQPPLQKTPLLIAIEEDHPRIVALLLDSKADVNARDSNGWTPLIRAAEKGDTALVQQLLQQGTDVNAATNNGFTARIRAFVNGHSEVVAMLERAGAR